MNHHLGIDFHADLWYAFGEQSGFLSTEGEGVLKKPGITGTRELDAVDRQIIEALREEGRMPFAQIAERLGVSAGMVRQRYRQMVADNVLHVVPVTNVTLLGYSMMAMIGVAVDGNRMIEIAREIAAFEEVIYLVICTGTYDLLVEVLCRDADDLLRFLTERLRSVKGVRSTETFTYLQIVKESYL
jgi:Lrp/AsnC family transcriptional regulator for asnA, asnC and gidA